MPTVVTNPLGELLGGIVQGYGLAHQIKQQAMQQEAHDRAMAEADRRAQVEDIQTRMMLDQNARPVSAGTVTQSGNSAPLNVAGIDLGSIKAPDLVRPVDKSRKVTYKGRDGQAQDYELLTPEEQTAKAVAKATSMKHAGSTLINTPEHLQKLGLPAQMYVPDEHLYQYAATTGELQPVETPQGYQEMGGPAQVPLKNYSAVTSTMTAAANRKSADTRAAESNRTRAQIAADNRKSADTRAADANKTRAQIAAGRNATTLQAASIRRDTPTPNAQGVQNRFQQKQLQADQKALQDLQTKESALHAQKIETGQMSPGAKDDAKAFVASRNAKLAALDLQIKGIQQSKQKLIDKWNGNMPQQQTAGGRIRVKIGDQTGTIDAAEFDPKTMQKLEE